MACASKLLTDLGGVGVALESSEAMGVKLKAEGESDCAKALEGARNVPKASRVETAHATETRAETTGILFISGSLRWDRPDRAGRPRRIGSARWGLLRLFTKVTRRFERGPGAPRPRRGDESEPGAC